MKKPTMLLQRVLLDVGLQLTDTIDLDYREICSRYEKEGMSFLTITLPRLDDALLKGLAVGHLTPNDFVGFRPWKRGGSLPALLQGFFRRVFSSDGSILDEPDVDAIFAIRQVTRLFKKVELPCSKQRIKAAYERYITNDREVDWRSHKRPLDTGLFTSICGYLWSDLEDFSETLYCHPGIFGIGATSEREKRNSRYSVRSWPVRAETSFPASYHAVLREDSDALMGINFHTEEQELPVRVVQVPKTLKTPRTISVEPSYMMLMQQSIAKPLMVYLESKRFGFKSIRFTDQSVNNDLARLGSIDGSLATIDLKDASDMVDLDLVRSIFRGPCPTFLKFIEDCRSTRAKMPDGTIIPLRKFASMGSANCFPIESMVFFTIVMYTLVELSGRVPSRRLLRNIARDVAIYGDDIIVNSSVAPVVIERLEDFGLRVNRDKSFLTGLFRESCGGDYYKGVNVTPAYVRHWDDTGTLRVASHKVAYVALSNTFYMKGLWHACQYLRDEISLRIKARIPQSRYPIGVLHFISFVRSDGLSYDSKIHGYRVRGLRTRSRKENDTPSNLDGFLLRAFQPGYIQDEIKELTIRLGRTPSARSDDESLLCRRAGIDLWLQGSIPLFGSTGVKSSGTKSEVQDNSGVVEPPVEEPTWLSAEDNDPGSVSAARKAMQCLPYSELLRSASTIHGELFPWHRRSARLGALAHLDVRRGVSLEASDRPHSLCLKSGWTASPAGLNWTGCES